MIKVLIVVIIVVFMAGLVCGALICRRNSPIVEKAVALVKALIAKIKNKIKGK